jgi:hypothetical protein
VHAQGREILKFKEMDTWIIFQVKT